MDNKKTSVGRVRWTILAMLLCATTINYMDRVALAQLKPIFEVELKWTEADYEKIVFTLRPPGVHYSCKSGNGTAVTIHSS